MPLTIAQISGETINDVFGPSKLEKCPTKKATRCSFWDTVGSSGCCRILEIPEGCEWSRFGLDVFYLCCLSIFTWNSLMFFAYGFVWMCRCSSQENGCEVSGHLVTGDTSDMFQAWRHLLQPPIGQHALLAWNGWGLALGWKFATMI